MTRPRDTEKRRKSRCRPRCLLGFRWFVPRDERTEINMIIGNLKKDVREMRSQGFSPSFISFVVFWQTARTITAYIFAGTFKALLKVTPVASFLRRIHK